MNRANSKKLISYWSIALPLLQHKKFGAHQISTTPFKINLLSLASFVLHPRDLQFDFTLYQIYLGRKREGSAIYHLFSLAISKSASVVWTEFPQISVISKWLRHLSRKTMIAMMNVNRSYLISHLEYFPPCQSLRFLLEFLFK